MKTAFECFQQAAKCEEMARAAQSAADRTVLLATAEHWRTLGRGAKTKDASEEPKPPGKPR